MRPQWIVCKLSVNVIIHLEVKLNCSQILKNTCLPEVSIYILAVLCYKNEQTDILLIPPQYEENLYKTSYRNNNAGLDAFYVKSDNIRFPRACQNISSVEQLYFYIRKNADIVRISSTVWKLCPTLWSKCIIQNMRRYISFHHRQNKKHLPLDYRLFERFLCLKYRL